MARELTAKPKLFVIVLQPVLLLVGCAEEAAEPEIVRPVRAIKVGDASTFSALRYPGRAKAHNEVNIAFEVSGRLVQRPVNVGGQNVFLTFAGTLIMTL